ncbi:J domain-containing protein [Phaeospirillum tilakii]|uniref:J domain-containing protein n=1 Tax=Phaeospirillum tilakii TaxID=741673 RepID=A0ABW5CGA3_9PROT
MVVSLRSPARIDGTRIEAGRVPGRFIPWRRPRHPPLFTGAPMRDSVDRDNGDGLLPVQHAYTIPCPSFFRDQVTALAARRGVGVADLAHAVLLTLPGAEIARFPDPGEPAAHDLDLDLVMLAAGPGAAHPWRDRPHLEIRLAPGFDVATLRRALALALALDEGALRLRLEDPSLPVPVAPPPEATYPLVERRQGWREQAQTLAALSEENEELRAIVGVLTFEPLPGGVRTREEALHVLGFPPGAMPDQRTIRAKFRMLATIHHPDSRHGSHQRMSQLNAAIALLRFG